MVPATAYIYVLTSLGKGPAHGLGIAEDIASFTRGETLLGPGTLYRVLRELAEEGWIVPAARPPDDPNPHRKYYEITERGRERLARDVRELDDLVKAANRRLRVLRPLEGT